MTNSHIKPDADDLKARLRKRSDDDRKIQANNEAVAAALMGQRLLFDQGICSPSNNFAVRLCLEYENCAKNDAKLAQDWEDAADRIEQLEAEVRELNMQVLASGSQAQEAYEAQLKAEAATAAAYEVAARAMGSYHWNRYASKDEGGTLSSPAVFTSHTHQHVEAIIRDLATPDQIAALDKLIAEAVKPYVDALRALIYHTHECERELTEALYHADFCGESRPLTDARAILAMIGEKK